MAFLSNKKRGLRFVWITCRSFGLFATSRRLRNENHQWMPFVKPPKFQRYLRIIIGIIGARNCSDIWKRLRDTFFERQVDLRRWDSYQIMLELFLLLWTWKFQTWNFRNFDLLWKNNVIWETRKSVIIGVRWIQCHMHNLCRAMSNLIMTLIRFPNRF